MSLMRLVFYARNNNPQGEAAKLIRSLLNACSEYSPASGLTGGLVFNEKFFIEAIEGERDQVSRQLRLLYADGRMEDIIILGMAPIDQRLFEGWAVGYASRKLLEAEPLYMRYGATLEFDPTHMSVEGICRFILEFTLLQTPFVQRANPFELRPKIPEEVKIKVTRLETPLQAH